MDLKSLFKRGCTIKDMVHHFVYHMEVRRGKER